MVASLVSETIISYDEANKMLLGEYVVSFSDKPNETHRKLIYRVASGTENAMLTRHGTILIDSCNTSAAISGTQAIEVSDDGGKWSDLPDDENKRALAQTSVRQAAEYSQEVERLMASRETRADAASPAARAYDLLKKVFPEILTWGLSGSEIEQYLNITRDERLELQALWSFQDTNRQVMVDLLDYTEQLPVTVVESPVDVSGPSPRARTSRDRRQ